MSTRVRSVLFIISLILLIAFPIGASFAAPATPTAANPTLDQLTAAAGGDVQMSIKAGTGVASFVSLPEAGLPEQALAESGAAADPETRARSFLKQYGALFGIRDQAAELITAGSNTDVAGNTHVRFTQTYRGLAVFAGELSVHMNAAGRVTSAGGAFIPDVTVATRGAITQAQAEQAAVAAVQAAYPEAAGLAAQKTELLVYRTGLVQGLAGQNYLAYRVEVSAGANLREQVFVDAASAAVLDRFSMIADTLHRQLYDKYLQPSSLVWEEGNIFPTVNTDWNNEITAAEETYNLFGSLTNGAWLSYNSNSAIMKTVNDDPTIDCPNANWNSVSTNYCTGVSGDDTVAHEWGHAYTEYTHNLIYAWQPGALNESYSDIWGETVDLLNNRGLDTPAGTRSSAGQYCSTADSAAAPKSAKKDPAIRWVSGEDDPAFGGPIRDMWRPECHGDPGMVTSSRYTCSTADGGGVHQNSGIPNHGFALTVDGGTYNGQTITGLGLVKAAHIYWQAQRFYQHPTTDFADHADALKAACVSLIGAPLYDLKTTATGWGATTPAITQTDCDQLDKVALAVQFRTAPSCSFTPMFQANPPALCAAAGDAPQNWLFQDFEAGLGAWGTQQTPVNPATWSDRPWTVKANAPDGHPGQVVFGPDPVVGDCSNDLDNGVTSLLSPVVSIPANAKTPVKMAWDHLVSIEIDYDGGNLKASVNGGAWTLVPASAFTYNPYNSTLATSQNDNPMAGQAAWTGGDGGAVSSKWGQSQIDLSKIGVDPGDTVQFRWDLGTDGCNGWDGWYMDDVRVYSCAPCATPNTPASVAIAKASATTLNLSWPAATGSTQYEVWTAEGAPYFDVSGKTCANPAPYACSVTNSLSYSAANLGDPAVNHSYVVRGANACGQASAASNRVGAFEFSLVKGN